MVIEMKKDLKRQKMRDLQKYRSWLVTRGIQVHIGRTKKITPELERRAVDLLRDHSQREVAGILGVVGKTSISKIAARLKRTGS